MSRSWRSSRNPTPPDSPPTPASSRRGDRRALLDHLERLALELLAALQRERAQRVDHLALLVHHVVELEQPLARLEVLHLDALLRLLDGARDERVREHLAFLRAHAIHQLRDALGAEQAHQVILERQEELRRARVALAAGAAAQLAVDAPRLVPLGADDVESADLHRLRRPCRRDPSPPRLATR